MTAENLRRAELNYRSAQAETEAARTTRNRMVREAVAAGWTHARIAEATGLTRGRVGQLANRDGAIDRREPIPGGPASGAGDAEARSVLSPRRLTPRPMLGLRAPDRLAGR